MENIRNHTEDVTMNYFALPGLKKGSEITQKINMRPELIVDHVLKFYEKSWPAVLNSDRRPDTVKVRYVSMYLLRKLTHLTLETVGRLMQRDHTTVLLAERKIESRRIEDSTLKKEIQDIEYIIKINSH